MEGIKGVLSYGDVAPDSFNKLKEISAMNEDINNQNIDTFIDGKISLLNGAGYKTSASGEIVTESYAKFAMFSTKLSDVKGNKIFGWFTKNIRGKFEGIDWGSEEEFQECRKSRESFFVGRMKFDTKDDCVKFIDDLQKTTLGEPWAFGESNTGDYPILKSYLEYELDRLYYESEILRYQDKLAYNEQHTMVLYNTNLIDKFGHDLYILGDISIIGAKEYVTNLQINPSKRILREHHFSVETPLPPQFFAEIDEIVFHFGWDVDADMKKYSHIIEDRRERFPEKYKDTDTSELGNKLDNAIELAKKMAQRNYKFIVPMYYPERQRIQLLMPIYLETSLEQNPDFALVLTPDKDHELYVPETILGLSEVYQDARLVAKPDDAWLNPKKIH